MIKNISNEKLHPNSAKKFCKYGHPLFGDNLRVNHKSGARQCKICQNRISLANYHKKQAIINALKPKPILVLDCNKEERIEYDLWKSMRKRCRDPKASGYEYYGGAGIKVDPTWDSFEQFLFDMGPRPSKIHSIDRIDNSKGYSKENCRWATPQQQAENRRTKYVCKRGHPWTSESTSWIVNSGRKTRRCKICYKARIKNREIENDRQV